MRYAFITGYTDNYEAGVDALISSIMKYMPKSYLIFRHGNSIEETAIGRFQQAIDAVGFYDAICLLDADMFLVNDCTLFFELASKGFIVTGSNGMLIDFNKDYQKKYDLDLGSENYPYAKVHTTAPIFLNKDNIDWFEKFISTRSMDHWDDFLYLNMVGISMGKDKKMLCMPPYTFTGIHHWQMKPATALFRHNGKLLSGTEEEIYMVHGKWWDQAWLQDLMPTMERYFNDENIGEKGRFRTEQSIKIIQETFNELSGEKLGLN